MSKAMMEDGSVSDRVELGGESPRSGASVPCLYCWEPIPAESFVFWTSAKRLLSATCPSCSRRVTLPAVTWRRWCASGR